MPTFTRLMVNPYEQIAALFFGIIMAMLPYTIHKAFERSQVLVISTDIGTLIVRDPKLRGGRPIIAGTGTSVRRIAALYRQGYNAEEIARRFKHLTITQVSEL